MPFIGFSYASRMLAGVKHLLTRRRSPKGSPGTAVVLGLIHVGACAALVPALFSWSGLILAGALYYLTGAIGICLGYHRLLTHRSFALPPILERLVATIGVLALQGGPIEWISTHRAHHAFSDSPRDPHDSRRGFVWSHIAWLYRPNPARLSPEEQWRFAPDLAADPYYRFLDASAVGWQIALGAVLFAFGGWSWVVWGIFVRLVITYHATWLVNSASHLSGYRTFRTAGADRSTNNWWVAVLAWGEGWHNNHHAFPFSASHGLLWWEFDVTWMMIRLLAWLRIAVDVKVPTQAMLTQRRLGRAPSTTKLVTEAERML